MRITRACVIARTDELPSVRLLERSLAANWAGVELTLLLLTGAPHAAGTGFAGRVLRPADIVGVSGHPGLAGSSSQVQARVLRPALMLHLLAQCDDAHAVVLLAPDAQVFAPPDPLERLLDEHAVMLVPRAGGRLPADDELPSADALDEQGLHDDELVAAAPDGKPVLEWWVEREIERHDLMARGRTRPVAGTPLDTAASAFASVTTCVDPGVGVSYWNLHERALTRADGLLCANGVPLRLMRFAGFRPDRPWWLSEHGSRVSVLDEPILAGLLRERARALQAAGWRACDRPVRQPGGLVAVVEQSRERLRRVLARALQAVDELEGLNDADSVRPFLHENLAPARGRLNRYLRRVLPSSLSHSIGAHDLHADDSPPAPEGMGGEHESPETVASGAQPQGLANDSAPSVLLLGYLGGRLGLGQAGRGTAAALRAAGVPVTTRAIPLTQAAEPFRRPSRNRDDAVDLEQTDFSIGLPDADVAVVSVNAPEFLGVLKRLPRRALAGRYVIGQWAWEASTVPGWEAGFAATDEVWVPSRHVAAIISAASPKPVVVVPHPVEPSCTWTDPELELPQGEFMFLFAFDHLSTLERKNPVGTIEAYKRAFGPDDGSTLVIKSTNAALRRREHARVHAAAGERRDIAVVDASLDSAQMAGLLRRADAYVSLHRAEGFGLTLAESMALGKPVIATRYGGNLDFMHSGNSYLVDYTLRPIGPDAEHYPADGQWAQPSIEHAEELMRAVRDDPERMSRVASRGKREVTHQLSHAAVGTIARQRLIRVMHQRRSRGRTILELSGHYRRGGVRGVARESVSRLLRPYRVYPFA